MTYNGKESEKECVGVPVVAQWLTEPTSIQEAASSILDLLSGLRILRRWSCGAGPQQQH